MDAGVEMAPREEMIQSASVLQAYHSTLGSIHEDVGIRGEVEVS